MTLAPESPTWRRLDLILVAGVTLATLLALGLPARVPVVDLPQHARVVALLAGVPDQAAVEAAQVKLNPWAPYWSFYLPAVALAKLMPVYAATRWTFAAYGALTVWTAALLLRALGGRVTGAPMVLLTVFGSLFAWGLVGMDASLPLMLLTLTVAERACATPLAERRRLSHLGWGLAALLVALYYAHLFTWGLTTALVWLLAAFTGRLRRLWVPLAVGTGLCVALGLAFRFTFEPTPYYLALQPRTPTFVGLHRERLLWIPHSTFAYGRPEARMLSVKWLAGLMLPQALLWLLAALRRPALRGFIALLLESRYLLVMVAMAGLSFVTTEDLFLAQRLAWTATLLWPFAVRPPEGWAGRLLGWATLAAGFFVAHVAAAEGRVYSAQTECVARFVAERPHPGLVGTWELVRAGEGQVLPVDQHLYALFGLESGGKPSFDFTHSAVGPLRAKDPRRLPDWRVAISHFSPFSLTPALAADHDTLLVAPPQDDLTPILGYAAAQYEVTSCGRFQMLARRSPTDPPRPESIQP